MTELKEKFIEALKTIDFSKLSVADLKTVAETAKTVSELETKSYFEIMAEKIGNGEYGFQTSKTLSELKEG